MFSTLLRGLSDANYDSLIEQETLFDQGWSVYYTIDADLLGNYCFPYGFNPAEQRRRNRQIGRDYIADEQIVLHTFFYFTEENSQKIVFGPYIGELQDMIKKAEWFSRRPGDKNEPAGAEPYFTGILAGIKEQKGDNFLGEVLSNYFSEIISNIIARMDGIVKLQNLIKAAAVIFYSDDFNSPLVEDAFDIETGEDDTTNQIMGLYSRLLKGMDPGESRKRDANAIDRTIRINNYIREFGKGPEKKTVLLYAFDAPLTLQVMNIIQKNDLYGYPAIGGRKISLYRTTQEQFAFLVCRELYPDGTLNREKTIEKIRLLKSKNEVIKNESQQTEDLLNNKVQNEAVFAADYQAMLENYNLLRNQFENAGLLKNFDDIYESVKSHLNGKSLMDVKAILTDFKARESRLITDLIENQGRLLDTLALEAIFNGSFIRGVKMIQRNV
ncbi:MAG TPA: hypothetical protein VHW43_14035, partial [Puia sp.]|nr:hypothetical protein [Puia sp.]